MEIHHDVEIDASSDAAWTVIGEEFGAIGEWSASLRASSLDGELGVGAVRTCEGNRFGPFPAGEVTEELTEFDPAVRRLTYVATTGLPWFVEKARNSWSIEALGDSSCRVHSDAVVETVGWMRPFGGLMKAMTSRAMAQFVEELKYRVEHGQPHPRNTQSA